MNDYHRDTFLWGALSIILPPVLVTALLMLLAWTHVLKGDSGEIAFFGVIVSATLISYFGVRLIRGEMRVRARQDEIMQALEELQSEMDQQQRVLQTLAEKQGIDINALKTPETEEDHDSTKKQ